MKSGWYAIVPGYLKIANEELIKRGLKPLKNPEITGD